jgi:hypothetical protein
VRHVPDGVLRRLDDEPLAIPDRATDHVAGCARCSARRGQIAEDTERAAQLLWVPRPVLDLDLAWASFQRELDRGPQRRGDRGRAARPVPRRRPRFPSVSLRAALIIGAIAIVVAGTAAAATLTTIFSPTHVAPVSVTAGDLRAISNVIGLGDNRALGGFSTPAGSTALRFGTLKWTSPPAQPPSTLAQASAAAGFPVPLPSHLPAGVGAVQQVSVQPRVSATLTFNAAAGSLDGSSLTLDAGPAVLAQYGGTNGTDVPTLAVVTMPRPTGISTGASLAQIEAFLLRQPGISPALAEEVRLLGDLKTTLPVPVPSGASERSVQIAGRPGVLLADSSDAAAAVVWEDGRGMLHVVAGILDTHDVLNVAGQLG